MTGTSWKIARIMAYVSIATSVATLGCEEASAVDLVIDDAPSVCKKFCQSELDCEWSASAELSDARDYLEQECIYACAYHTEAGALFIERSLVCADELLFGDECVQYHEQEVPVARVLGSTVEEYLECLWSAGLFTCTEKSFGLDVGSGEACSSYNTCIEVLSFPLFEDATWSEETSSCEVALQHDGEKSYYLDLLW